jgi:quercetin dioxygenase-like cupin family protein
MIVKRASSKARFRDGKMGKADLAAGAHMFCGLNAFEPGQEHEPHSHCDRDKTYLVLEGHGEVTIGDDVAAVGPGDFAFAAAGVIHSVRNTGDERLVVFVAMSPAPTEKS